MNQTPPFIKSLHRPFNQNIKASSWVCSFVKNSKEPIKSSEFNIRFYMYMINFLFKNIKKINDQNLNGLPSRKAIISANEFLKHKDQETINSYIQNIQTNKRELALEKQIFSTYKAASYYVNMAKDKFKLIDKKNELTYMGDLAIRINYSNWNINQKEREFYFERILSIDFLMIISFCFFKEIDENLKSNFHYEFLDKYYNIRHFEFTSTSLKNYNNVRRSWVEKLNILDKNFRIRKKYIKIIESDSKYFEWYKGIKDNYEKFYKNEYSQYLKYKKVSKNFESIYNDLLLQGKDDIGYVNLYDIKENLRISYDKYQMFLEEYYEQEKRSKLIFFNDIVNSIDGRKRFTVRNVPVLKIRIKQ